MWLFAFIESEKGHSGVISLLVAKISEREERRKGSGIQKGSKNTYGHGMGAAEYLDKYRLP
jgi:hypothetical protein